MIKFTSNLWDTLQWIHYRFRDSLDQNLAPIYGRDGDRDRDRDEIEIYRDREGERREEIEIDSDREWEKIEI